MYANVYVHASKKDKGKLLDQVVTVTGWSRDNARRRLVAASNAKSGPGAVARKTRKPRAPKYSYDSIEVLKRVWVASGGQCGKYLAASMGTQLDLLERHGELVEGVDRYCPAVRAELLAMSAASIDRYLRPDKARGQWRGASTLTPAPLLRSSIKIRKANDEVEAEPGFFDGDMVPHCGPTWEGEFARSVNLTDVHTGWTFTRTVRNNAHVHLIGALKDGVAQIPFAVTGLDFDSGNELLNKAVLAWAAERGIVFTRFRTHKESDAATIESRSNHLVRRYGFTYRYDTPAERSLLNRLWPLVNDRFNYLTPTRKPVGFGTDRTGRRTRIYDQPATPLERLLAAQVLAPAQEAELLAYRDSLNPAEIAREIADLQTRLLALAKDKAAERYFSSNPTALPGVGSGMRSKAS